MFKVGIKKAIKLSINEFKTRDYLKQIFLIILGTKRMLVLVRLKNN